jgi:hypothetical protein
MAIWSRRNQAPTSTAAPQGDEPETARDGSRLGRAGHTALAAANFRGALERGIDVERDVAVGFRPPVARTARKSWMRLSIRCDVLDLAQRVVDRLDTAGKTSSPSRAT